MQSLEEGGNSAPKLRSHGARSAPYKARQADLSAAQAGVCAHLLPIHACVTGYSTGAMSAQTASPPEYRLYKLTPLWGLPSASPACVRVEAYLRLAGVHAAAEECVNSSTSPSGQLPALEHEVELVEAAGDGSDAARAIIRYLKEHGHDLDAGLNASQRADLMAFTALVEATLEPATAFTTWCEKQSYSLHTRAIYGAGLPLPLNYWIPWNQRRVALQRFRSSTAEQIYGGAAAACAALDQRLRAKQEGIFFFGSRPSSLDALLLSHLPFYHGAPLSSPELRQALSESRALTTYVERLSQEIFSKPLPKAPEITSPEWAQRAEEATAPKAGEKKEMSKKDAEWSRGNKMWLAGAGLATVAYFIMSGQYITISTDFGYDEEDDEAVD